MTKPRKTPRIARQLLDAYEALWQCTNDEDRELQEWARTKITTNCYAGEYHIAQFILESRRKVRDRD